MGNALGPLVSISSAPARISRAPVALDKYVAWVWPGESRGSDERRRAKLLVMACHMAGTLIAFSLAFRILLGFRPPAVWSAVAALTVAVMLGSPFVLRWAGSVRAAAFPPVVALVIAIPLLAAHGGGLEAPILFTVPALPLVGAYFLGARTAAGLAALLCLEVVGIYAGSRLGWFAVVAIPTLVKAVMLGAFIAVSALIAHVHELERSRIERRLRDLAQQLYEASIRDPMTGAYNRRYLVERLASELAYARRHKAALSVVMLDLDHFKAVNDVYGHHAGDVVLGETARLVLSSIRQEDVLARYGGEEFVVVLRAADERGAKLVAERIRARLEEHELVCGERHVRITGSFGCATLGVDGNDDDALLAAADARLYEAKRRGRNRVIGDGARSIRPAGGDRPRRQHRRVSTAVC